MTAADLVIGILVLGLVIYRQLIPRRVKSNMRIVLVLAVIGLIETGQYLNGRHLDATLIAEILGSLVLAAVFGLARASTVKAVLQGRAVVEPWQLGDRDPVGRLGCRAPGV